MLFGLFGKKEEKSFSKLIINEIYISKFSKQNAVLQFAIKNNNTIFIAWFENTFIEFENLFETNNIASEKLCLANNISSVTIQNKIVVFLEHHPLRTVEEAKLQYLIQETFVFYNALTEPIFQLFGGENIILLMLKMGYKEGEKIQHKMIDKSIIKAQNKIADSIVVESNIKTSQEEWLKINLKQLFTIL